VEPAASLDPTIIVILVMVGVIAIEAVVFGAWIWYRGQRLAKADEIVCYLRAEIRRLERVKELRDHAAEGEALTGDQITDDFNRHHPDLDSGDGAG